MLSRNFLVPNAPLQEADSRAIRSLDLVSLLKDSLWAPEFDTVVSKRGYAYSPGQLTLTTFEQFK